MHGTNTGHVGAHCAMISFLSLMECHEPDVFNTPEELTHALGGILDLTLTNIPRVITKIERSLHLGSEHEILITVVSERVHHRP